MRISLQRPKKRPQDDPGKREGLALISILMMLSLATILAISYMVLASGELKSSSLYSDGISAQQIAESSVNLVIHQIRQATNDSKKMWVSQPGMVRTYDTDGIFAGGYKLYSDDTMVVRDDELRLVTEDRKDLEKWASDPARWVDLNAPVIRGEEVYYPIADPAAANTHEELDADYKGVEGFRYSLDGFKDKGPLAKALEAKKRDPLPMPVQWLYQLKDGTLGSLDESRKFEPLMSDGSPASEKNPVVARMAFWADDESCKINVNTASEPTFWDTPRAAGIQKKFGPRLEQSGDRRYGWSQPTIREYQRFPGHPATTALSTVLLPGLLRTADPWTASGPLAADAKKYQDMKEFVYRMAPKIQPGGSMDATVPYRLAVQKPVKLDRDRLYPNIDEYLFQAPGYQWSQDRGITYNETDDRLVNAYPSDGEDNVIPKILPHAKFFLTANSRAPEVNLFGMPRVSIWPTHVEKGDEKKLYRSTYDDLIRFCAATGKPAENSESVNGGEEGRNYFFFQREDSDSPTHDWTDIARNRQVFEYLKRLTSEQVPGYGGRFSDKFGSDHEQVLTSIFDYIRSVNLYDDHLRPKYYTQKNWLKDEGAQFTDGRVSRWSRISHPGHGQVTPIEIEEKDVRGMGRSYTVSEVGILMICNGDAGGPHPDDPTRPEFENGVLGSNNPEKNNALPRKLDWRPEHKERCVQAMLMLELFTPSQGWTQIREDISIGIEFEKEFSLDQQVLEFPVEDDVWQSTGEVRGIGSIGETQNTSMWGGTVGFWGLAKRRLAPERGEIRADGGIEGNKKQRTAHRRRVYPFISVPVIVDGTDEKVDFSGGRVRIEIRQGTAYSRDPIDEFDERPLIQALTVEFPDHGTMPLVKLAQTLKHAGPGPGKDPDPDVDTNGDGNPANDWQYQLKRGFSGDPPRYRNRPAGILFPSYWWSLTNRGCRVGHPVHGDGNWVSWKTDPADKTMENMQTGQYRGRLSNFGMKEGGVRGPSAPQWCFHPADVVRTMVPRHGDYRLIASKKEVPKEDFVPHRFYFDDVRRFAHHFTGISSNALQRDGYDRNAFPLVPEVEEDGDKKTNYHPARKPDFPQTEGAIQQTGDFDNGVSITVDGAYINKPDEGNGRQWFVKENRKLDEHWTVPYYQDPTHQTAGGPALFSPNRQVPSAVMFGSLPTGVKRERPWQTLLFRPQKEHPGNAYPEEGPRRGSEFPPDHALLDLFWMPVVEPYAISEPFSTAGKINLNYQMLPFTYIERSTGLRAVLISEEMLTIPVKYASEYKKGVMNVKDDPHLRRLIDLDQTLKQFEERFKNGGVFRSASEICDIHLVPKGTQLEEMEEDFWEEHALTGDNSRERPYANVYPRLTAKSNTFRVHYIAQVLRKAPNSSPEGFDPTYDTAVAEYRGSTLIERYLEPHDPNLPDYADESSASGAPTLEQFYKFRVINSARFAP